MEKLKKGYCFEGSDGNHLVIIGEALSRESGQMVYLCQELTGECRLMIWTAREISGGRESEEEAAFSGKSFSESRNTEESLQNMMIRFLEASSCSEKLELLDLMKGKVTESMLESMAISMDYELGGGSVEEKYYALERFLKTRNRYEGTRLR